MWITGMLSLSIVAGSIYCQTDVRLPPTITQDPTRHVIYRSDDSVTLLCKAFGIPAVDYEWKKNEVSLNLNQPNIKRILDGFGSITISPITSLDEGYYQCMAKNQYGTAMSDTSYLQMAVHLPNQQPGINRLAVTEGEPFHMQNRPPRSIPSAIFEWESANDAVDKNPTPIELTKRKQIADNGDLYFAYAIKEDDLGGRIYKSTAFNEYLDLRSGGSYTNVTVNRVPDGVKKFAPTLGFSSPTLTMMEGKTVSLRCFFSGNPEPSISWTGPRYRLPVGRYCFNGENSKLQISYVKPSDQGDYICTGINDQGSTRHTLQIKVEAEPKFLSFDDRPHNTNITEGNSISFNCKAHAVPEATITWYRNGQKIDVNAPPKRYSFSKDTKTLTIQNLCRNCDDRPDSAQSDLAVIQCNASNVHGYVFGAGYVNVLMTDSSNPFLIYVVMTIAIVAITAMSIVISVVVYICCRRREITYQAPTKEMRVTPLKETLPGEGYETIPCNVLSTNQSPSPAGQRRQTMENVRRSNTVDPMYAKITDNADDPAYDDCIVTAEGETQNVWPSTTAQHDENTLVENGYTGLTDRENAYLTMYTDLQQNAQIGTQEYPLSSNEI